MIELYMNNASWSLLMHITYISDGWKVKKSTSWTMSYACDGCWTSSFCNKYRFPVKVSMRSIT